ncbi:GNAT family N-acetyltransferase [Neobacillus vireti]|uniref:GNAT family N-acetyltransferase n=1 Tax=Neobacillus vireti TaxID=220686 RepID=UPI002FFDAE1F
MIEFRLLHYDEFDQAIALADKTFRDDEQISMGDAFPYVFSHELSQSYGAFINNELVSFIGLVPSVIHLESAEIRAYSIGAVCTHPNHRKKGFASILLEKVIAHVKRAKASILFVSGDLPIYRKAGCTFYGERNVYEFQKGDLPIAGGYSIREFLPYDWFELRKLNEARKVYVDQSIFDFAVLHQSKGFASIHKLEHKILVAESGNEIKGFIVLGVPNSSTNQTPARLIEWGGDPQAIHALLANSFQHGVNTLKLSIPTYETELNGLLGSFEKTVAAFPGTIKITNLNLLLKQLQPYFNGKIKIEKAEQNYMKLLFHDKSLVVDDAALEKMILQGNPNLDADLQGIFPIPLPFPEGLNYV